MRSVPALALALAALPSLAHAEAQAIEVELVPKAQAGQGQPRLTVLAHQRIDSLRLDVVRSTDGRRVVAKQGPLRAGRRHDFELPLKAPGTARFAGSLHVRTAEGEGAMPLEVEVTLLAPLTLSVDPADVDLGQHVLRIRASRPLERVQIALTSDTGTPLGTTEQSAEVDEQGRVVARWEQEPGRVLRISVKGTDADGFFGGLDLFPWRVDIPHEDVVFATGQARIPADETPKLAASLEELKAALDRYGKLAEGITVFVAGHTDTVGDGASNQALSERRARAIGSWFREAGLRVPIRYAGFGESMPLIETPDDTDEARNRRAEYIVAIEPPALSGRSVRWRPL